MAVSRRPLDVENYASFEGREGAAVPGFYSRTNLNDIINNFIVAYIGEGKVLNNVPRHEVAFWAQRVLQEFSYDTLHSEKTIEIELNDAAQMPLPSDYVNYVKLSYLDNAGYQRTIQQSKRAFPTKGVLQDQNYDYLYDNDGNLLKSQSSESTQAFQDPNRVEIYRAANSYYQSYFDDDDYSYYYQGYFGRRYGNDPQNENVNGTFFIDTTDGVIYFDHNFRNADSIITLRYISDGLGENGDFNDVYVPKLAEDALYTNMLYNLAKVRPSAAQIAPLYKKEAFAKLRNAKIRLSNMKIEEIAQVMRGKSKWIKH